MKFFLITIIFLLCSTFLVPFFVKLGFILAEFIESKLFRDDGNEQVGATSAQVKERVKYVIPSLYDVDFGLVDFLVSKGFGKRELVLFLSCNKLPKDFLAGVKSGSKNEIGELREMVLEYISVRIKARVKAVINGF